MRRRASFQRRQNIVGMAEQQRAGGRTQKRLDAADARQPFQLRQRADIGRRRADIEGIIAMHPALGAGELVLDRGAAWWWAVWCWAFRTRR